MADTPKNSQIPAPMRDMSLERDTVAEIAPKLAQHEARRSQIEVMRERAANSAGKPAPQKAEPGNTYRGPIVALTREHVLQQREDRANVVIQHDRIALSGAIREGKNMEISYPHGKAGLATEIRHQRGHDRQQHQHQHNRGQIERERD